MCDKVIANVNLRMCDRGQSSLMKIMLIAGARPNFMKIASIIDAINTHNRSSVPLIDYLLVHTGQHYDERMSQVFFKDLGLPKPDIDLNVGSSSHAHQTAEIMKRFEPVLLKEQPDVVVVVGDVNSTVACALVAAKTIYDQSSQAVQRSRPLVAHVEAGLRSFDRSMPEEINRILTDAISDFLFVTEDSAEANLTREGIAREKIYFVGNTMADTLLKHMQKAKESNILYRLGLKSDPGVNPGTAAISCPLSSEIQNQGNGHYAVVTLHRASNVDHRETFQDILEALSVIAKKIPILFPIHPRTMSRIKEFCLEAYFTVPSQNVGLVPRNSCIHLLDPLGYLDFLCLMSNAKLVLTDSGGIQEETTVLGIPCITLRQNTERPITITHGTNVLTGTKKEAIIHRAFATLTQPSKPQKPKFWDGHVGERIIQVLMQYVDAIH